MIDPIKTRNLMQRAQTASRAVDLEDAHFALSGRVILHHE